MPANIRMKNFKKILDLLTTHERKRGVLLLCMILVMAILDMLGVASILPFMAVMSNPELVETNYWINAIFKNFGFTEQQDFFFALGLMVFVTLVFSLGFKALTTYSQLRFTLMREHSIGKRLVEGYLHQPYSWFLSRNSADLSKNVLSEVSSVINQVLTPMMTLISQGAVAIALLGLLIIINPKLAFVVGMTLSVAYILIFMITRGFLVRIGQERVTANKDRFFAVSEAFGAYKEIKFGGLERIFVQRFSSSSYKFALHQASSLITSQLPRFALEAIAFGGLLLVMLYLMTQSGSFISVLPIITLYAFAGYRLLPALQQIYAAITQLRFAGPALDALHDDFISLQYIANDEDNNLIKLNQSISLKNID